MVVNNDRAGIRYENSSSEALFQNNEIQGNGVVGGIDIRDSQNAQVLNNNFGGSGNRIGVRATDSGRSDRVDLRNRDVKNNTMNRDIIKGCELLNIIVDCAGNTP